MKGNVLFSPRLDSLKHEQVLNKFNQQTALETTGRVNMFEWQRTNKEVTAL